MELADPMITGAMNFACKHHTPQYVWSESKNCHANGVENLSGIWIVSSNVSAVVEAYKDICSATIYRHENGVHIFDVEHLQLRISDRDQCWFDCSDTCEDNATSVAMIEFAVQDLNTTRSYFGANGIEWREYDSSSLVGIKLSEAPVLHFRQQADDHTSKVKR